MWNFEFVWEINYYYYYYTIVSNVSKKKVKLVEPGWEERAETSPGCDKSGADSSPGVILSLLDFFCNF